MAWGSAIDITECRTSASALATFKECLCDNGASHLKQVVREDTMNADLLVREETARRANEFYESGIRDIVETEENIGKMVIIDLETGHYEFQADDRESVQILKQKNPNARLYGIKIGYDVAVVLGGILERSTK
jgi:hypothetical protein